MKLGYITIKVKPNNNQTRGYSQENYSEEGKNHPISKKYEPNGVLDVHGFLKGIKQ